MVSHEGANVFDNVRDFKPNIVVTILFAFPDDERPFLRQVIG